MTKINGGATLWARQTIDSDIFYNKPDKWFKIWFYLINEVNHKDNKQFKRGSCFMKYDWIMGKTRATKNQVKHCIEFLKKDKMLATQKATRGFIVKVNKYNDYQTLDSYKKPQEKESKRNTEGTQKPHSLNKYGKYDKYVIKEKSAIFLKAWKDFKEMRRKIKKPMTDKAEEMLLNKLSKLSDDVKEQITILNESTMNDWKSVYPLKDRPQNSEAPQKYISKPAMTADQIKINQRRAKELVNKFSGKFSMPDSISKGGKESEK